MASTILQRPLFKQMRKGTKSCRECRRRKIKCIYNEDSPNICQECLQHSRQCLKQGHVSNGKAVSTGRRVLQVRINQAETAMERMTRGTEGKDVSQNGINVNKLGEKLASEISSIDNSPVLMLFNNERMTRIQKAPTDTISTSTTVAFSSLNLSDRRKLLSTISAEPSILDVLDVAGLWWTGWRDAHWALRKLGSDMSLRDYVTKKLESEDMLSIAMGLMCLAMSLLLVRPGLDDVKVPLSSSPREIMEKITAAVDQVVIADEEYFKHEDIVLVLAIRGKIHAESNHVRKAWLLLRKALLAAQALGLGLPKPGEPITDDVRIQQQFLGSIFEVDRIMSMVFGLPYTPDSNFGDGVALKVLLSPHDDIKLRGRALRRVIALAAQKINDRNAHVKISVRDEITAQIEETLNTTYTAMPSTWWDIQAQEQSENQMNAFESLMVQLYYWCVSTFVYLPYMIQNDSNQVPHSQSIHRSSMCLTSARNLIRTYIVLRSSPSLSIHFCNPDDFQGVLGGCILIVSLLQGTSRQSSVGTSVDPAQPSIEHDLMLLEDLKDVFRYNAFQQGGVISKQGLLVLEELTSFLQEEHGVDLDMTNMPPRDRVVMLPYFGTIHVKAKHEAKPTTFPSNGQMNIQTPVSHYENPSPNGINYNSGFNTYSNTYPASSISGRSHDSQTMLASSNTDVSEEYPAMKDVYPSRDGLLPATTAFAYDELNASSFTPADFDTTLFTDMNLDWEQWSHFQFDSELSQAWNPGLDWDLT